MIYAQLHVINQYIRSCLYILCVCADRKIIAVNGTLLQVPVISSTEVKLCVSEVNTSSNMTVVLAHRYGDPHKLLAYFLNTTNCITTPAGGDYIVGVFTLTSDNILKPPATPPTIETMTISEYHFIVKAFMVSTCFS